MARVSFRSADLELPALNAARTGLWCSIAAFLTWFAMGVESILRLFQDNRREAFWALPFFLTLAAFICTHRVQRRRSRIELIGFAAVLVAAVLVLFGSIGLQLSNHFFQSIGSPGGPIAWFAALVCFGVGTLLARTLPWYAGAALIVLAPASILHALALSRIAPLLPRGPDTANIGNALAMLLIALALHRYIRAAAQEDACYIRLISATQGRRFSHPEA